MDFILDNLKIFILVGAAVLWLIGKVSENRKKQQEQRQEPWSPADDDGYEFEEPEQPPQRQSYRPMVPPPLPSAVAPPVLPTDDRELSRQRVMQERLNALKQERTAVAKAAKKSAKTKAPPMVSPSSLKARLRNRGELRRTIVMREILDPPVGLR